MDSEKEVESVSFQNEMAPQEELDSLASSLFENTMKGEWEKVVEAYQSPETSKQAQELKITKSGETALHVAVLDGQKKFVRELVDSIGNNAPKILNIKNMRGNTPLHLAAAHGDVAMCHEMAIKDPKLVSVPNHENETPLFVAALSGNEEAFLCLNSHCEENCYSFRASNGDTILHAAITSECFSLAFQILLWHPELVNAVNQNGESPLHILACTPTAFKSSSCLRPCDRLMYHCLIVEELKGETDNSRKACPHEKKEAKTMGSEYADLTKTWRSKLCCSLIQAPKGGNKNENARDAENPRQRSSSVMQGISSIKKIHEEKRRHTWATQVMNKLVEHTSSYMYLQNPEEAQARGEEEFEEVPNPILSEEQAGPLDRSTSGTERKKDKNLGEKKNGSIDEAVKTQTPILIAAKMGVTEMVEKILDKFPVAIQDVDFENKNVALLAVENRQPHVYNSLLHRNIQNPSLLRQVDNKGNNALHLAAKYGNYRPWLTPGAALQMQWELKWYMGDTVIKLCPTRLIVCKHDQRKGTKKWTISIFGPHVEFVKNSMPPRLSVRYNDDGHIPKEIFTTSHKSLQKEGSNWLVKTSESCSVVAALIATVAFATSASVPGGLDDRTGEPVLKDKPAFNAFTISSLLALCLSVTALVFFLSILTSRYEAHDFSINLPRKLLLGLTSLFASIASVLVSFCTGHIFLLDGQLRNVAYPLYAATCLPVTIFALAQLPLYYDLIRVIFKRVPHRSYQEYKQ